MSGNRRIPIFLLLIILGALLIPPALAEELYDSGETTCNFNAQPIAQTEVISNFKIYRIQDYPALKFLYVKADVSNPSVLDTNGYYAMPVTFYRGDTLIGHGNAYYNGLRNSAGTYVGVQCWIEIDD